MVEHFLEVGGGLCALMGREGRFTAKVHRHHPWTPEHFVRGCGARTVNRLLGVPLMQRQGGSNRWLVAEPDRCSLGETLIQIGRELLRRQSCVFKAQSGRGRACPPQLETIASDGGTVAD